MFVFQCVVRASVTGVCDAFSGGYSAQLFKTSENVLTDAIRLQVCRPKACTLHMIHMY
jgi:hypothetical protein